MLPDQFGPKDKGNEDQSAKSWACGENALQLWTPFQYLEQVIWSVEVQPELVEDIATQNDVSAFVVAHDLHCRQTCTSDEHIEPIDIDDVRRAEHQSHASWVRHWNIKFFKISRRNERAIGARICKCIE